VVDDGDVLAVLIHTLIFLLPIFGLPSDFRCKGKNKKGGFKVKPPNV
jgi:hypothetical protein